MDLNTQNKLITTSKITGLILHILFVLLLLIIITPWLFPATKVGEFLFGMYEVTKYIDKANFEHFVNNLIPLSRILGLIGSVVILLPLLIGIKIMHKLTKSYVVGDVFNYANAKSYSVLGVIYLLSAVFLQPISDILFSLCVSLNNPVGQRFIGISFTVSNLTAIFFAILLIIIGRVMQLAQKINDDQEFML